MTADREAERRARRESDRRLPPSLRKAAGAVRREAELAKAGDEDQGDEHGR